MSNYKMAADTFLTKVPIPKQNIHPIPTEDEDFETSAREYEKTIRSVFGLKGGICRYSILYFWVWERTATLARCFRIFTPRSIPRYCLRRVFVRPETARPDGQPNHANAPRALRRVAIGCSCNRPEKPKF